MVMAAGLGTRLRPLTDHLPKPLAPVANRPVLEHLLERLAASGLDGAIVNLHWFPDAIRDRIGDGSRFGLRVEYSYEEELLGTAGGTKRCEAFLRGGDDDCFLVTSGDGLHDVDMTALVARHRAAGATATLALKPVADVERFGVAMLDDEGLITGFQEKPARADARSDLASLGVYCLDVSVLDRIPAETFYDFGKQVFPELLADGARVAGFVSEPYWSDIGSISELVAANLAAVSGTAGVPPVGHEIAEGVRVDGAATIHPSATLTGPLLIGDGTTIEADVQVIGPAVIGPGCRLRRGAGVREAVLLDGTDVREGALVAGGVLAEADAAAAAYGEGGDA